MLLAVWSAVVTVPLLVGGRSLSLVTMLVVVTGAMVMIGCGLRTHRPARPLPWYLLSGSAGLFAAGSALRDLDAAADQSADICLLAAYCVMAAAVATWLRPRRLRGDYDLALDSTLIGLAALLASWTFLISPAVGSATPVTAGLLIGHPLLGAVLLALLAHSVATVGRSEVSLRLLHLGLAAVLVGDLVHNLDHAGLAPAAPVVQRTPMLLAYAAIGIAALHPTMAALGGPHRIHPHRSRQRASVIAGALIVASLVPVLGSTLNSTDRVVVSSLFALLLIGVLLRSERAIQRSQRSERRAQYQADHDMLTGLLNRSALLRALSREHTPWRPGPLGLLFIDLDGFKRVNDNYGHAVGDELIADAAARIRRVAGRDPIVARYGGDEFVVLAPCPAQDSAALAERLLAAFTTPFALSAGEVRVTASIGIASTPSGRQGVLVDDLIRDADAAMYHAKERALGYAFHPNTVVEVPAADRDPAERADSAAAYAGLDGLPVMGRGNRPASVSSAPAADETMPESTTTARASTGSATPGFAAAVTAASRTAPGEATGSTGAPAPGAAATTLTTWLRRTGRQTAGRMG
ncbi:GGDEF domain-containing protein [Nocardia higoensis]|uniref:GGDEF domain-containing protein n=1 Tax=Nocardia higoensis TaxID=228599 RepID=UPI0003062C43|nr:GGDEF domain-containing protein [Nocardia higoensis]